MSHTSISTTLTAAVTLRDGNRSADDGFTVTSVGSPKTTAVAIALDTTNLPTSAGIVINNSGTISAAAAHHAGDALHEADSLLLR
ncbi:hypothetical protein [Methylobacterium sp. 77]|uniref:hypothetical protein n=1 Tax=Methylobacterium sp. 77 TaxID=1101192 RepID=UPI0012DDD162|nr:hypothetical protein [Methylobacterium sp. 77]